MNLVPPDMERTLKSVAPVVPLTDNKQIWPSQLVRYFRFPIPADRWHVVTTFSVISATYDPSAFQQRPRHRGCCSLTLNSFNGCEEISKSLVLVNWAQSTGRVDQIVQLPFVPLLNHQLLAKKLQCQCAGSHLRLHCYGHFIRNTFLYWVPHNVFWCSLWTSAIGLQQVRWVAATWLAD